MIVLVTTVSSGGAGVSLAAARAGAPAECVPRTHEGLPRPLQPQHAPGLPLLARRHRPHVRLLPHDQAGQYPARILRNNIQTFSFQIMRNDVTKNHIYSLFLLFLIFDCALLTPGPGCAPHTPPSPSTRTRPTSPPSPWPPPTSAPSATASSRCRCSTTSMRTSAWTRRCAARTTGSATARPTMTPPTGTTSPPPTRHGEY